MSFQAMTWAIKQRVGGPAAKAVLLCLANYADDENQTFASQARIAEEAEVSLRTVRNTIRVLEEKGMVKREARRRKDGTRTTDLFTLSTLPAKSAACPSINRQNLPHQPAKSAGPYKDEPITEPITKEKALKNGGRNQDREPQRTEKVAKGFQSLSASLAKVVPAGKPDRRKQAQGAAA